jgi:hypothetical protein
MSILFQPFETESNPVFKRGRLRNQAVQVFARSVASQELQFFLQVHVVAHGGVDEIRELL